MVKNLTQKEKMHLEDQKNQEELCIKKYNDYAYQAQDAQLKQLFKDTALQEQQHLNTINSILAGQVPNMNQQSQQQNQAQQSQQSQQQNQTQQSQQNNQNQQSQTMTTSGTYNANDAYLCNDLLSTEKYVSNHYDTTIFEFRDHNIRNALNHIQKEEQEHGEKIYNYMEGHGMYNTQQQS